MKGKRGRENNKKFMWWSAMHIVPICFHFQTAWLGFGSLENRWICLVLRFVGLLNAQKKAVDSSA